MKPSLSQVFEATQLLPKRDRRKLRDLLNEEFDKSSDLDTDEVVDDELYAEIRRRSRERARHPERAIPVDVALQQLREKYA